ncbi:MAG: RNA polymerase sigma factor [Bacteroidales bacterium]|nr:RNA polymerase sigma factor [Bacteroidales bacterium]
MSEEEKKIIKGCIAGDKACQKRLYLEYGPMIKGICARYAANAEDAEDLFHDTFLFILVNFPNYNKITSLGAWLRRITINKAIDYYRKTERQRTTSLEDLTHEPGADAAPLNEPLTMPQLVGFINELPDKYRTAFNLYVIDGYEQEEIMSIMDESSTNVRTLIFRARNILQKKIQQYLNHEEFSI